VARISTDNSLVRRVSLDHARTSVTTGWAQAVGLGPNPIAAYWGRAMQVAVFSQQPVSIAQHLWRGG